MSDSISLSSPNARLIASVLWCGLVFLGVGCTDPDSEAAAPVPRSGQLAGLGPAPKDALLEALAPSGGNVLGALQLLEADAARRREGRPGRLDTDLPVIRIVEGSEGTVRELYLQGIYITDEGLPKLAGVNGLQRLHLHKAPISDVGLERLARFPDLSGLSLGRLDVTDRGLAHLAGFKSLKRLVVEGPRIGTEGVRRIANLRQLEGLGLSGLGITDAAIEPIAGLECPESLKDPHQRRGTLGSRGAQDTETPSIGRHTGHLRRRGQPAAGVARLQDRRPAGSVFPWGLIRVDGRVEHDQRPVTGRDQLGGHPGGDAEVIVSFDGPFDTRDPHPSAASSDRHDPVSHVVEDQSLGADP